MASTSSSAEESLENTTVEIGTLLLEEEPFVYALYDHLHEKVCDFCLEEKTEHVMLRCSACKYVHYCDKNCQKAAWKDHKRECKYLKENHNMDLVPGHPVYLLVLRTILKLQRGGSKTRVYYTKDKFVTFIDLKTMIDLKTFDVLLDDRNREYSLKMQTALTKKGIINPNFSSLTFQIIYITVTYNIAQMFANGEDTGFAIYLSKSLLNHSCEPNAIHTYNGKKYCVRAIKQITDFNWEKITITYVDTLDSPANRRNQLEKIYKFKCKCDACVNQKNFGVMTGLACIDDRCKGFVDANTINNPLMQCNICLKHPNFFFKIQEEQLILTSSEIINTLKKIEQGTWNPILEMLMGNLPTINIYTKAQGCLYEQEVVLHKYHYLHVLLLKHIFIFALREELFEDAIEYGNAFLDCLSVYVGDIDTEIGITHLRMSKILKRMGDLKWKEHFEKGKEMYNIMFGEKLAEKKIFDLLWGTVF